MRDLDSFDKVVLRDYLAENWSKFVAFCEERGESADEIYQKLDGEPE